MFQQYVALFAFFTYYYYCYYYYYYVKHLYIANFIEFFPQAIPLDMYVLVFCTNTHVKHWDLSPNHNCVIICFLGFQPDNDHIWPKLT